MKDKFADWGLLWLRALCGFGMMMHGWLKVMNGVENFAAHGVEPLGFPVPLVFAWLAVGTELIGGFFFVLGLWTRLAALAGAFMMGVAAFGSAAGRPYIDPGKPSKELALCYLVMIVTILIMGPGRFAVDGGRGGGKRTAPKKGRK